MSGTLSIGGKQIFSHSDVTDKVTVGSGFPAGVIVNTNRNTEYRKELEGNEVEFRNKLAEIEDIKRWKDGVTRALWIIFGILATVIVRMLIMHSETGG